VTDEIRTDPGIEIFDLIITSIMTGLAVWSGGLFWMLIAIYLWFSAIVAKGFWPYLSDDDIIEIRRREMDERIAHRKEDDNSGDLREGPPEDQD
jgi:hypothetical protein